MTTLDGSCILGRSGCLFLILVDSFFLFPDEGFTRRTGEVDNFLTLLTVFLKRLTAACFPQLRI